MKFPTNVIFLTIISLMSTEAVVKRQKPGDTGYIDFNNNSPKNYPSVSKFKTIIKTPEESLEIESKPTEVPLTSTQKIKKKNCAMATHKNSIQFHFLLYPKKFQNRQRRKIMATGDSKFTTANRGWPDLLFSN